MNQSQYAINHLNKFWILLISLMGFNQLAMAQPRQYRDGRSTVNPLEASNSVKELISKAEIFKTALIQTVGPDYQILDRNGLMKEIEKSNAILSAYTKKVDEFMASSPHESFYSNHLKSALQKSNYAKQLITKIEKDMKSERSLAMVYSLQELEIYKVYTENMMKVYPNENQFKDHLKAIVDGQVKLGTPQAFMDRMEKNQEQYVQQLKMDPPAISDPALEQFVKVQFAKRQMDGLNYEVSKVHITRSMWTIEKNDLGIPTYKWISACMAIKTKDGKCGIATTYIRKDYAGGGTYGEQFLYTPTSITIVPCSNL